jgi:hypothetical protein
MEGMAPGDTRHREPEPTGRAVFGQGGKGVFAAGRREPAARPEQRADEPPVPAMGSISRRAGTVPLPGAVRTEP